MRAILRCNEVPGFRSFPFSDVEFTVGESIIELSDFSDRENIALCPCFHNGLFPAAIQPDIIICVRSKADYAAPELFVTFVELERGSFFPITRACRTVLYGAFSKRLRIDRVV